MAICRELEYDSCRTYATEENLRAAVKKAQIPDTYHFIIIKVPNGKNVNRYTPVFIDSMKDQNQVLVPVHAGFMTVG